MEIILDYQRALERAAALFGENNALKIWIPEAGFDSALEDNGSLSFTRDTSENGEKSYYGFGIGPNPPRDKRWSDFSLPQSVEISEESGFEIEGRWEVFERGVAALAPFDEGLGSEIAAHLIVNRDESDLGSMTDFLAAHAPTSSTFPGSDEVIAWVSLRSEGGALLAVAAITKWESGGIVLSSVAVDAEQRGKGLGQRLMFEVESAARERGISYLVLAVLSGNEAAVALYKKCGWKLLEKFFYYSKS